MPGYDISRFEGLTEEEDLTCSICHCIFREPCVAPCCGHSFCKDCIADWLRNNNTCPFDRKRLLVDNLQEPQRIPKNFLGKLKIRCDYEQDGCMEIVRLENLAQ